jgi:hypothetical protein
MRPGRKLCLLGMRRGSGQGTIKLDTLSISHAVQREIVLQPRIDWGKKEAPGTIASLSGEKSFDKSGSQGGKSLESVCVS